MRNQTHNRKRIAIDISLSFDQFMALQKWVGRFSESDFFFVSFFEVKKRSNCIFQASYRNRERTVALLRST